MKVNGLMEERREMELSMPMEIFIKENGILQKLVVEFTGGKMVIALKEAL